MIDALRSRGLWATPDRDEPHPARRKVVPIGPNVEPVATYEYRDSTGTLVGIKGRWEAPDGSKSFRWRLPTSATWAGLDGLSLDRTPLWGAELVAAAPEAEPVYYVEGEKAATACRKAGLLAVTHGGGAATKTFGDSLLVLRNRPVRLWPDNDEPGRRYMQRVAAALNGIAGSVAWVTPALPEKGDAYDYFAAGGTADALQATGGAEPTATAIDYLAHDALRVRIPVTGATLVFTFTEMEKTTRALDANLDLQVIGPGAAAHGTAFQQRVNLLSSNQRTELRRELNEIFGKELGNWTTFIHTAFSLANTAFLEQDRAIRSRDIAPVTSMAYTVDTLLPSDQHTVLFGDGSSSKTYLTLAMSLAVATGAPFLNLPTTPGGVLFVDYETSEHDHRFRMGRLISGLGMDAIPPNIYYWPARGIPFADQADAIRRKVERAGISLVIIDSAAAACGGKPEDADITLGYFQRGLTRLGPGVTTLTIAHIPKGGDTERAFGSVFWHNQARRTWFVKRIQEEESDQLQVGLFCRKINDGRKPRPLWVSVTFSGDTGPVVIERAAESGAVELDAMRSLKDRVRDLLLATPGLSSGDIAERLDSDDGTVRKTLSREKRLFLNRDQSRGGRGVVSAWYVVQPDSRPQTQVF